MRKLLNTLYITNPVAYLSRDGENVVVKVDNQEQLRLPIHNLESIVCFGFLGVSPSLMSLCAERSVALSFLTESGYFLGKVIGPVSGNVLLRRKQYRMADDPEMSLNLARLFIAGKIANCRNILQRTVRDHSEHIDPNRISEVISILSIKQKQAIKAHEMNYLRGIEGEAAQAYFGVFDQMIVAQKEHFYMKGRNRRPPLDNVNSLLSFAYVLLMNEVRAALESVGLDPCVGFLHVDRPGRQSLALDMMEELRPYFADRLVLSLINRKQVNNKGFAKRDMGGVLMDDLTRKEVISAWQKRKQEEIKHPFLNEKIPIGLLPYVQSLLLARFIRGDINNYPVHVVK